MAEQDVPRRDADEDDGPKRDVEREAPRPDAGSETGTGREDGDPRRSSTLGAEPSGDPSPTDAGPPSASSLASSPDAARDDRRSAARPAPPGFAAPLGLVPPVGVRSPAAAPAPSGRPSERADIEHADMETDGGDPLMPPAMGSPAAERPSADADVDDAEIVGEDARAEPAPVAAPVVSRGGGDDDPSSGGGASDPVRSDRSSSGPPAAPPPSAGSRGGGGGGFLTLLLSLLVAGAVAYGVVWWADRQGAGREGEDIEVVRVETERAVADLEARLDERLGGIEAGSAEFGTRLEALGEGPAAQDLAAELSQRIDAIDARLAGTETGAQDAGTRVATLEQQLSDEGTRVATLERQLSDEGTRVGALERQLSDVTARVDALAAGFPEGGEAVAPDALTPLRSALAAQDARTTQVSEDLGGRLDAIDARLSDLADLPGRLDSLSEEVDTLRQDAQQARDGLSDDLDTLRADAQAARDGLSGDLDTLRQDAQAARDALSGDLDTLRQEARQARDAIASDVETLRGEVEAVSARVDDREAAIEEEVARARAEADAEAEAARAEAALAQMRAQIDAGAPYDMALTELLGHVDQPVPATLINEARTGVPTLGELREAFTPLAREALVVAPAGEDSGRVESFFRRNLGVRSLEPREGSDVDAVLSRADDALGRGDIEAALTEVEALPEPARALFEDWVADARNRVIVEGAAASLARGLEG